MNLQEICNKTKNKCENIEETHDKQKSKHKCQNDRNKVKRNETLSDSFSRELAGLWRLQGDWLRRQEPPPKRTCPILVQAALWTTRNKERKDFKEETVTIKNDKGVVAAQTSKSDEGKTKIAGKERKQ